MSDELFTACVVWGCIAFALAIILFTLAAHWTMVTQ